MTTRHALQQAIAAIDTLIEKLQSGALSGPTMSAVITAAAAPGAPAAASPGAPAAAAAASGEAKAPKAAKPVKQKQPKPVAAAAAAPSSPASPEEELFSKAQLAVAKVTSVGPHPNSDKLYICKVDVGGKERQVVAGLQKHVPAEELRGSLVVVVLNLKPAKLAGELSEAMILAASVKQPDNELVRVLRPAAGAEAGQAVVLEGAGAAPAEYPKQCKQWSKVVEGLAVKGGRACFCGRALVTAAGAVLAGDDMPDGAEIH